MNATTNQTSGNALVRASQAWNEFWFAPSDPTTLGVVRLFTGLLVLYAHLAYSYDLQEFFGKDAWLSLREATIQRQGAPRPIPPTSWDQGPTHIRADRDLPPEGDSARQLPKLDLPTLREERDPIIDFVASFPNDPAERQRLVALLRQPTLPDNPDWGDRKLPPILKTSGQRWAIAEFVVGLPSDQAERTRVLDYIREWNVDPRQVKTGGTYWSVWYHLSEPHWMVVVHCLILAVMLMFAVGFCTRVTSVLTWLAALSYINRSPNTFYGADAMMMVSLLYLMIGPSGAAVSVDAWLARRRARREGLPEPEVLPSVSANLALRLFQVQFCIIYMAAGTSKLLGGRWWNGQALYYTLANYEFSPVRHEYFQAMLTWLCQTRWLWEIVISAGTWFTIALELALPLLVWNRRLRLPLVLCSVLLHTFIAVFMGLVVFSLMMGTMVLSFVPSETMRQWLDRIETLGRRVLGGTPILSSTKEDENDDIEGPEPAKSSEEPVKTKHRSRR